VDKTALVAEVAEMFRVAGHHVQIDVQINHRRIDIVASELQGIIRKKILVECAEYASGVGVDKIQEDYRKLQSARDFLKESCVFLHVSSVGYSPAASGWALEQGLSTHTLADLRTRLVNFEPYLSAMESDKLRNIILNEYQATTISIRQQRSGRNPIAIDYLSEWVRSSNRWLTLLGDYGVGKSWALKRLLYRLIDDFRNDPSSSPLPFFIPLQHFTKAFDYQNLLLATMQRYNLSGVPVEAFNYMARHGRIVFLLDSFDEMAQHLSRATIRSNLNELLVGIGVHSKAIMTSRPNYFENRSERLLFVEGVDGPQFHSIDDEQIARETILAKDLEGHLENSQVVRLNDLTPEQRRRLFRTVLGAESAGYRRLNNLFNRFQQLASISQRAVIARLLTTVAESLADPGQQMIDGESIIPEDLSELTQERIFRIILHNLLHRDRSIGDLNAGRRLLFLRSLAVRLQTKGREPFINPDELRQMIADLFSSDLRRTDTPESLLESYYRTCRRHSGLTTEGQFFDTSGRIDIPVEDTDNESRVGFSHNVLREFLVADAFADFIVTGQYYKGLDNVALSDTIIDFVYDRIRFIDNAVAT
jgi:predicted NACHT family NTPase